MAEFIDANGKAWTIKITGGDVAKVGSALGIDLGNPSQAFAKVLGFTPALINVLFHLARDPNDRRPTNPERFADGFGAATIEAGTAALEVALTDFFQGTRIGADFSKILQATKEIETERQSQAAEAWAKFDPRELVKSLKNSSGNWADKQELTHGR